MSSHWWSRNWCCNGSTYLAILLAQVIVKKPIHHGASSSSSSIVILWCTYFWWSINLLKKGSTVVAAVSTFGSTFLAARTEDTPCVHGVHKYNLGILYINFPLIWGRLSLCRLSLVCVLCAVLASNHHLEDYISFKCVSYLSLSPDTPAGQPTSSTHFITH